MSRLGDTSAIVIPAGQLSLTRRGKTRMNTVGIVFEFYTALQHDLQQLEKWSENWRLRFNSSKCKVMHLGRQKPHRNYTMGATTLATITSEKDLGVYVDTTLTFEKHIETVLNHANRMIGLIRRSYTYLDSQSLLKHYTSLVRPTLE